MVLESFVSYIHAEKRPDEMVIFGFIIATISILLALWVFPSYASFAMVTFTVMASLPLMVHIMQFEKEKQEKAKSWKILTHKKAVLLFLCLFLGFTVAFALWFLLLPTGVANNLFFLQANTITEINSPSGAAVFINNGFFDIFFNNLRVLALSILFSFIFGSGAIFILAWNASVLGVAMGSAVKMAAAGSSSTASYFGAFSFALVRYLIHGIPEIAAYFLGGLAGGIIAFTVLDYKLGWKKLVEKLPDTLKDVVMILGIAIALLLISTTIEIFITPLFIR